MQGTKVYSGKPYLRYQELQKTMKNRMLDDRFFPVFWASERQVTLDNDESYSNCSLMVPLENKIAVDPPGFETKKCGLKFQKTAENDHFST